MWQSKEEEEKQKKLEKLIDWELNKQLTWGVVFLTTILGLMALLAGSLLKQWIDLSKFPLITMNLVKAPFVIIFFLLLIFGVDLSFYRLATSLERLRNWEQMLPNEFERQQLLENVPLECLYKLFVERTERNSFSLRTWFVLLLIVLGDILLIWALISMG